MPRILSVNTGKVARRMDTDGTMGDTGVGKQPQTGPVAVGRFGLAGDESAYRKRDLGDTAVHIFCAESYARFRELGADDLTPPCFGENLTVEGYTEAVARPGDVLRAGTALLRVCQPVVRCSWPVVQSGEKRLTRWATAEGITGFYLEVVEEGVVTGGDALTLEAQGPEGWTIQRLNLLFAEKTPDAAAVAEALALPQLADRWKGDLRRRHGKAV